MENSQTLYDVLGVPSDATLEQIRERYRILAREVHPDINPTQHDIATFIKIRRAYETLKSKQRREEYDRSIGIYHVKDKSAVFLRDSSLEIVKKKLDKLNDHYEESDSLDLPKSLIKETRKETSLISKILSVFRPTEETNEEEVTDKRRSRKFTSTPKRNRTYQFAITPLESIMGTERIIVLDSEDDKQNSIKVKIPKGISDRTTLRIIHPIKGKIAVKVIYQADPLLKRDGLDVTLIVPFTNDELRQGYPCKFYTCKGQVKIKLPADSLAALKINGHGLTDKSSDKVGDFFLQPIEGGAQAPIERIKILNTLEPLHKVEN